LFYLAGLLPSTHYILWVFFDASSFLFTFVLARFTYSLRNALGEWDGGKRDGGNWAEREECVLMGTGYF